MGVARRTARGRGKTGNNPCVSDLGIVNRHNDIPSGVWVSFLIIDQKKKKVGSKFKLDNVTKILSVFIWQLGNS